MDIAARRAPGGAVDAKQRDRQRGQLSHLPAEHRSNLAVQGLSALASHIALSQLRVLDLQYNRFDDTGVLRWRGVRPVLSFIGCAAIQALASF